MGGNCSSCPQHLGKSRKNHKGQKGQKGGATYEVSVSDPIKTASGVPLAVNNQIDPYCSWTPRGGQAGGKRRATQKKQRGGSCGCGSAMRQQVGGSSCGMRQQVGGGGSCDTRQQVGGGGGTGGYGFDFAGTSKLYPEVTVGTCPGQPVATPLPRQAGGMAPFAMSGPIAGTANDANLLLVDSYKTGFNLGHAFSTKNESAHFLEPVRYDKSCMGGGSRSKKQKRQQRRNRQRSRSTQ